MSERKKFSKPPSGVQSASSKKINYWEVFLKIRPSPIQVRETFESLVIAFVLAFLFRTFEAEAFVIPTGSMSPTLQGRHKDVHCPQCDSRFRITSSEEIDNATGKFLANRQIIAGVCPSCQYVLPIKGKGANPAAFRNTIEIENFYPQSSFSGDRILVNKYRYLLEDPSRWDVIVFRYPANTEMNYIKRLVGLPGETLQLYQGDVFSKKTKDPTSRFEIVRKPAAKVQAMKQLVHDSGFDSYALHKTAGYPQRWRGVQNFKVVSSQGEGSQVSYQTQFEITNDPKETGWIKYTNWVPRFEDWQTLITRKKEGEKLGAFTPQEISKFRPQLVNDFNPYNARKYYSSVDWRAKGSASLKPSSEMYGLHWVGDLQIDAEINVKQAAGTLHLVLVEGGKNFRCDLDLTTGQATLSIEGYDGFKQQAATSLKSTGTHRVQFANVDDQLFLWIDETLVSFEDSTYDAELVYGGRENNLPHASEKGASDLSPAHIGLTGGSIKISRIRLWRDIYYISVGKGSRSSNGIQEYGSSWSRLDLRNPKTWDIFTRRAKHQFPLNEDQIFAMGDNSPGSLDSRIWYEEYPANSRPGGAYLEKRLLIGKAIYVFWPHTLEKNIGTRRISIPFFPNFGDMRIIR